MTGGGWTEETVHGHLCDIFEPTEKNEHGFLLIYLHGWHQQRLVDKSRFGELFENHGLSVVAPHSKRSWWTDRICPEFDTTITAERYLLDVIMPFVADRFEAVPPQIGLLGTSMGGQGALRIAYKHPNTFPVVAAIAPAVDFQLRFDDDEMLQEMYTDPEAVRQDSATLHIHPLNWPRNQFFCCDPSDEIWWDSADRLRMKLWSLGVPHECDLETTGGGHDFAYYDRMAERAIGFLVERLENERLRVP